MATTQYIGYRPDPGSLANVTEEERKKKTAPTQYIGDQPDRGSQATSSDPSKTAPTQSISAPQATTSHPGKTAMTMQGTGEVYQFSNYLGSDFSVGGVFTEYGVTYQVIAPGVVSVYDASKTAPPIEARKPETMRTEELPPQGPKYVSRDAEFAAAAGIPNRAVPAEESIQYAGRQAQPEQIAPTQYLNQPQTNQAAMENAAIEEEWKRQQQGYSQGETAPTQYLEPEPQQSLGNIMFGNAMDPSGEADVRMGMAPGITPVGGVASVGGLLGRLGGRTTKAVAVVDDALSGLAKAGSKVAKQQQIGRAIPKMADLITKSGSAKTASTAARYASNPKSLTQTANTLLKKGVKGATVAFIIGAFGTYPFASWGRQEVLSGLKILSRDLREAGDVEGFNELADLREDLHKITWHDFIPYVNVIHKFREFTKADVKSLELERELWAKKYEQEQQEEEKWDRIYREQEEREEKRRIETEEYYAGIEEARQKAKEEEREEESDYYDTIAEKNRIREEEQRATELQQRQEDEAYYDKIYEENKLRAEEERAAELAQRAEDEEYWANIYAENEARKAGGSTETQIITPTYKEPITSQVKQEKGKGIDKGKPILSKKRQAARKKKVKPQDQDREGESLQERIERMRKIKRKKRKKDLTPEELKEIEENWNAGKTALSFAWLKGGEDNEWVGRTRTKNK